MCTGGLPYPASGKLKLKITQSGVDNDFRMVVPVYLETANGKVAKLGAARLQGNSSLEAEVGLAEAPKRVMLNYFSDVLCDK